MPEAKNVKTEVLSSEDAESYGSLMLSMGSPEVSLDIVDSIKSRYKILYIVSCEEERVLRYFELFAKSQPYQVDVWDCNRGLIGLLDGVEVSSMVSEVTDPLNVLDHIIETAGSDCPAGQGRVHILLDYHRWLEANDSLPQIERKLKLFASTSARDTIVIVAPVFVTSSSLDKYMTMMEFPYPSQSEVNTLLDRIVEKSVTAFPRLAKLVRGKDGTLSAEGSAIREAIVHACSGLTIGEVQNACAKSLRRNKIISIDVINAEKEQIIRKSGLLEYCKPKLGMDDVGGLEVLKSWLSLRIGAYSDEAREFGLPIPKGLLLVGVPGSGKSLTAKACATLFNQPLLRLDLGAMFGSKVGESERRIREALRAAEAVAPVVLWCDEIEKGLSGAKSSGSTDGGTAARVVATLLTWMNEKSAPVFIVATANNKDDIPPEFMRAGRFDEIFFVDIPNREDRIDIASKLLRRKGRNPDLFNLEAISDASQGYVGAEMEKAIESAMFMCFSQGRRPLNTDDVVAEFAKFVPISKSRKEEISEMREWAKSGGAVIANSGASLQNKVTVTM